MLTKTKTFNIKAVKGAEITPDMLNKINKYAQGLLTVDDVYVQKYIMAHNGIDRDRERFPEDLLAQFAATLPGKSLLEVHDKTRLPVGLYFDAKTEDMSREEFKSLTGEDIRLPNGMNTAKVVYGWVYMPRKDWNQKLIDSLSSGVFRHVSIGFSATDLKPVKGEFGQTLYSEYSAPGEAREGSIVYLGAQQGATVQKNKSAGNVGDESGFKTDRDGDFWKDAKKNPLIPQEAQELEDNILIPSDSKINVYDENKYDAKREDKAKNPLVPAAGEGKESLVNSYASLKVEIGDVSPDKLEHAREIAKKCPEAFLKKEIEVLEKRKLHKQNPLIPEGTTRNDFGSFHFERAENNPLIFKTT